MDPGFPKEGVRFCENSDKPILEVGKRMGVSAPLLMCHLNLDLALFLYECHIANNM